MSIFFIHQKIAQYYKDTLTCLGSNFMGAHKWKLPYEVQWNLEPGLYDT